MGLEPSQRLFEIIPAEDACGVPKVWATKKMFLLDLRMTMISRKNHTKGVHIIHSAGIAYHQHAVLYIIIANAFRYTPKGVMRYKGGIAAFDDIHANA